ncbi:MAG: cytochrome c [Akkermansiaceae bacterium]|nr:cytochrome c [Akkermansiaceae bacterium]MCF7733017.1 cytochrome c [Akkermansiaceae bacterium]
MNWEIKATMLTSALLIAAPAAYGDAAATYAAKCASCHGKDGKGQTTMGKKMKVLDYTTAEGQKWADADGVKVILEGKGKMKGYKDKGIDEAAAKDLVKYIRAFKK